jgi:hypothetical protein
MSSCSLPKWLLSDEAFIPASPPNQELKSTAFLAYRVAAGSKQKSGTDQARSPCEEAQARSILTLGQYEAFQVFPSILT